jgi:4-hydroxy-tetrahydrodipicolinate synthase
MFSGTATALITPFKDDGRIDEEGLRELVVLQEEAGVDAIVPCGTTGESATLSHDEHLKVIAVVIDQATSAKVIAGAGSNSTHEAVLLSKGAEDLGADYILSITPYYNKPTQKGIVRHYETITRSIETPIIVYNVPGRTGCNIKAETTLKLAELSGIDGIKEASGDIDQIMTVLAHRPEHFSVLSGEDALTYSMMSLGADGVISVASNAVPGMVKEMVDAMLGGDHRRGREMHFKLLPLFRALFLETNPIPIKTAMRMLERPAGAFRLPLCDMDLPNKDALGEVLEGLELL